MKYNNYLKKKIRVGLERVAGHIVTVTLIAQGLKFILG